jgi:hypothetical protein
MTAEVYPIIPAFQTTFTVWPNYTISHPSKQTIKPIQEKQSTFEYIVLYEFLIVLVVSILNYEY